MDFEIIRENFDRIRKEKGLKMKDLAAGLNVTPQSIYSSISGKNITVGTLQKIADLLGVDAVDLLQTDVNKKHYNSEKVNICPYCGKRLQITIGPETDDEKEM